MDDYTSMNIYEYIGDKKQESSTATNISKEEHEMQKIAPQNVQQRPQINQSSTARSGNQVQEENIKNALIAKMKCFVFMAVIILAVTLLISLAAMVLSILSYNASSNSIGLKTQKANLSEILVQFNTYKLDVESMLKQINSTLLQQNSVQNATVSQLVVEQVRLDTYTLIDQLTDNISSLVINLNYINNYIKSVAATTERNISKLFTQLDATNDNIMSVATTVKKNISQLSNATNNDIRSVATTVQRNVSQLSTQLEAANNDIRSVATTVQRNVSQLSTQLEAANNDIRSVATTVQRNVSQLSTQLEAANSDIRSVATTVQRNVSQLSTQLEAANNDIRSVATTVQRNVSQLSTQLEAANSDIRSVATTVQRNVSQLSTQLEAANSDIRSVATTVQRNVSQLSTQLEAANSDIRSVATTVQRNVSQLSTQLEAANSDIRSVATTVQRNVSQLSTQLEAANSDIRSVATTVQRNISQLFMELDAVYRFVISWQPQAICGDGLWHRVAHLNMSDPSQQCPPAWREYNNQFRACGRPVSSSASRISHTYPINHQYSKVCGRIIGIQVASPDGFHSQRGISDTYIDGVSITYGSPRNHIWTFVGYYSETATGGDACPCGNFTGNRPQSFVGNNYYCESGNPTENWVGQVFPNDKLWDGEKCSHEGTCCTGANTPPWFSVSLNSPTSDDIEVRICGNEGTTNEDTPIELLEIYVQ